MGVITDTPGLTRSSQSLMPLGLPLRTRNTIVDVYGRAVVRQTLLPVLRNELPTLVQRIDVVGERKRYDIGIQPVDHGARLLAGTTVGLPDGDGFPGLLLPVPGEGGVEILVQFPRRIVGDVQQAQRRAGRRRRQTRERAGPPARKTYASNVLSFTCGLPGRHASTLCPMHRPQRYRFPAQLRTNLMFVPYASKLDRRSASSPGACLETCDQPADATG